MTLLKNIGEKQYEQLINLGFHGAQLPIYSLFDAMGWILSITAKPAPDIKEVTEENFFIPLLSLYSKWIITVMTKTREQKKERTTSKQPKLTKKKQKLLPKAPKEEAEIEDIETFHELPGMTHISYWSDPDTGELVTLFGSAPVLLLHTKTRNPWI